MEKYVYVIELEQPWENWSGVLIQKGENISLIANDKGEIIEVNNDYWGFIE